MLNAHRFCPCAMVILLSTVAVFAEDPLTDTFAIDVSKNPTSQFQVSEPSTSTYTVNDTLSPVSGGAAAIVGYGTTPEYSGTLLAEADVSRFSGDSDCGLLLQLDVTTLNAYFLSIDFQSGQFDLSIITNGVGSGLDGVTITDFNQDNIYSMEFTYNNGSMTGNVYDESDTLVGSVSATDTTYAANTQCGILASTNVESGGADSTRGSFANFNVVPEPITLTFLGIGAAGLIARRKRS